MVWAFGRATIVVALGASMVLAFGPRMVEVFEAPMVVAFGATIGVAFGETLVEAIARVPMAGLRITIAGMIGPIAGLGADFLAIIFSLASTRILFLRSLDSLSKWYVFLRSMKKCFPNKDTWALFLPSRRTSNMSVSSADTMKVLGSCCVFSAMMAQHVGLTAMVFKLSARS